MASTPSGPTLTCAQCSHANEAERVYCHNCGAKLDRSLLPKVEEINKDSIDKTRRRVQRMTNPGGFVAMREVKALVKTLSTAAVVALLIGIVREPDDVPPVKPAELSTRFIGTELADALESPQPRVFQFTQGEANNHLHSALKSKDGGFIPGAKFERAFVKFEPGNVNIGLQQSLFGFSLYSGARYHIGVKDGKFFAINEGGNFGRVGIHPLLMRFATSAFNPLFHALKKESDQIQSMEQVIVDKGRIGMKTKGKGK